jgi:hypothetical protein
MIVMTNTMSYCLSCFCEDVDEGMICDWADYVSSDEEPVESDVDVDVDDIEVVPDEVDTPEGDPWDVIMEEFSPTPSTAVPADSITEFSQTQSPDSDSVHPNVSVASPPADSCELDIITVASSDELDVTAVTSSTEDGDSDCDDMDVD